MNKYLSGFYAVIFVALLTIGATTKYHEAAITGAPTIAFIAGFRGASRKEILRQLAVDYPGMTIAQDYLRSEAYLQNGVQSYAFPLFRLGSEAAVERKLDQQDAFCITELGIRLLAESVAVAGIGVLQTYPNPIVFPDEAAAGGFVGLTGAHLEHIYNGRLILMVGQTTFAPGIPVHDCRVVRTAQRTSAANHSEQLPGDGLIPLTPQYDIKGQENNQITLAVPGTAAQHVASNDPVSGYKTKLVLWAEGFRIVGGSGLINSKR